jgi:hypothetical protein
MLTIILDSTIVNVALPSIKADLGFSQSALAWVAPDLLRQRPDRPAHRPVRGAARRRLALDRLELPYRLVDVCTPDLTCSSARINCSRRVLNGGWSARRLAISATSRVGAPRSDTGLRQAGRPQLVHTLNASAMATPRVWAALLEHGLSARRPSMPHQQPPRMTSARSLGCGGPGSRCGGFGCGSIARPVRHRVGAAAGREWPTPRRDPAHGPVSSVVWGRRHPTALVQASCRTPIGSNEQQ